MATIVIENNVDNPQIEEGRRYRHVDEIKQYLDCRYVSAIEACWRIYEFELQKHYPTVERLEYHLPNQQFVIFNEDDHLHNVVQREDIKETMLTKWFEANQKYVEARSLTYAEFPTAWVWKRDRKERVKRKHGKCIGRMPYAHANSGESYYLRMLLYKVRGAQCFEDLRTFNGILYPTFKQACRARGLLEDDNEWHEASNWASSIKLRYMFSTMLMFSEITDPVTLWEQHWRSMVDDLEYRVRRDFKDNSMHLAALHKSELWSQCKVMHLKINMRLSAQDGSTQSLNDLHIFAEWINNVGEGKTKRMHFDDEVSNRYKDSTYLKERAILAPKNSDVDEINSIMLSMLPGEVRQFYSADTLCPGETSDLEQIMNPPKLLHSIKVSGIPNHCLELKEGAPIMFLRNLNQSLGMCNGTRLIILKMGEKVLEARIITGSHMGEEVLIPHKFDARLIEGCIYSLHNVQVIMADKKYSKSVKLMCTKNPTMAKRKGRRTIEVIQSPIRTKQPAITPTRHESTTNPPENRGTQETMEEEIEIGLEMELCAEDERERARENVVQASTMGVNPTPTPTEGVATGNNTVLACGVVVENLEGFPKNESPKS
ncbi:hypothetical protein BUALT_Bualt17G0024800 [Buddleja alternifolia]|uniref:ATP-dependent DNA helicase n=1 Tax=Buddleja alternifolia TaxID=168488 RepID=A0AAV6W690_9LAMI|nr:hypothetical protein BUALT_Bualt17G0024800 [Buddleja alternifolia]